MSVHRISFEATNACNLNCLHCLRDDSGGKRYLDVDLLEKALVQVKRYGSQIIIFTGGEPLLHPQLNEMVDRIAHHGYSWFITTNGTLLDRLKKLLSDPARRSRCLSISLSLDGGKEETNDFIRGPGVFRKVMKAISYLKAKGVPICLKTSVNTLNIGEMEELVNLSSKLGAEVIEFSQMHPTPELIRRKMILPRERWAEVNREVGRLQNIYRTRVGMCAGSRCTLTFAQCAALQMNDIHFDFDGNLSACCVLPNYRGQGPGGRKDIAGNLRDKDFWDLHSRLIGILAGVNQAKIRKIKNNSMTESDYYPCIFCLKHFGKLGWLKELDPQNEWISDDGKKEKRDEAECASEAAG